MIRSRFAASARRRLALYLLGLPLALLAPTPASPAAEGVDAAAVEELASDYWRAYEARDWPALARFYTPESTFRDPSFVDLEGRLRPFEARGAEEIVSYLESAHESTLELSLEVEDRFVVGPLAVLQGTYRARSRGDLLGAPGRELDFEAAYVAILRVEAGKVVEHTEYNDHPAAQEQYLAQGGSRESLEALVSAAASERPAALEPRPAPEPVEPRAEPAEPATTDRAATGPTNTAPTNTEQPPTQQVPVDATAPGRGPEHPALAIAEVRRLAVVPFVVAGEIDDTLTLLFADRLRQKKGHYEVLRPRELMVHLPTSVELSSSAEPAQLLAAARRAGADAVILGDATTYRAQADYGARLRVEMLEVNQGEEVWSGGGWGTSGISYDSAKQRAAYDTVRKLP